MLNGIICGDSRYELVNLSDDSIDSIVTDPPYELGFMNRGWDKTGVAYDVDLWCQCLRVLKPGGHLLSFGGTRTYHRMVCAIEDAGFEIRDQLQWIYGSGFPKGLDISKAIDKRLGMKRKIVGVNQRAAKRNPRAKNTGVQGRLYGSDTRMGDDFVVTVPASSEAQKWDGWGTCLKPANEPIVLARKPISEKTIADNVLKWGTGGLNIDECRIGDDVVGWGENSSSGYGGLDSSVPRPVQGRFPADVLFDEPAAEILDKQKKGASRFFYVSKASKKERGEFNNHPTVKPLDLMRYLVRLVTPPGGIVLDPFAGSGTTGLACMDEGFDFILIERDPSNIDIIHRRLSC